MNDQTVSEPDDVEDICAAVQEGRPVRAARSYRIAVSDERLNFQTVTVTDPVPLGRQILAAAGFNPHDGYSLFGILHTGEFEDVRLDEPFDLRGRGIERFVAFRTDRDFKLTVNDAQLDWGKPAISGAALYVLAKVADEEAVFLEVRGGEDRLIERDELIDLTAPGIERFITGPKPTATIEIIVNTRPKLVTNREVTFEQIVELAYPGPHDSNYIFSMSFRHAASKPHAGDLGPGGSVTVKQGTIFNVVRTIKS